jgi:hypothetical protein
MYRGGNERMFSGFIRTAENNGVWCERAHYQVVFTLPFETEIRLEMTCISDILTSLSL